MYRANEVGRDVGALKSTTLLRALHSSTPEAGQGRRDSELIDSNLDAGCVGVCVCVVYGLVISTYLEEGIERLVGVLFALKNRGSILVIHTVLCVELEVR